MFVLTLHLCEVSRNQQAELMVLQSSFAVGDECFEQVRPCLVEEAKMCPQGISPTTSTPVFRISVGIAVTSQT